MSPPIPREFTKVYLGNRVSPNEPVRACAGEPRPIGPWSPTAGRGPEPTLIVRAWAGVAVRRTLCPTCQSFSRRISLLTCHVPWRDGVKEDSGSSFRQWLQGAPTSLRLPKSVFKGQAHVGFEKTSNRLGGWGESGGVGRGPCHVYRIVFLSPDRNRPTGVFFFCFFFLFGSHSAKSSFAPGRWAEIQGSRRNQRRPREAS